MGVDFYTCQNCSRNFPDCGGYFTCFACESMFCSNKCGGRIVVEEDFVDDKGYYNEAHTTCVLCRKEEVTDHDLLLFILERHCLTYEEAVEAYKKED